MIETVQEHSIIIQRTSHLNNKEYNIIFKGKPVPWPKTILKKYNL